MDESPTAESLLQEIDRVVLITGGLAFERIAADEDSMSDEAHREADKRVFPKLRRYSRPLSLEDTFYALYGIARSAEPFLTDSAIYNTWNEVENLQLGQLVCKLLDTLMAQGEEGTFKEVRRFKLLRNPFHFDGTKLPAEALNERQVTRTAWGTPFIGDYHKYLYNWIMDVKAGKTSSPSSGPYYNILPIIQSSGTGKSRLAHEVASLIFTLPLNVHGRLENKSSVYPEPDGKVAEWLTAMSDRKVAKARHRWFLRNLIQTAVNYLQEMTPGKTYKSFSELACAWRAYLSESGEATESRRAEMNKKSVANAPTVDNLPKEADREAYLTNGLQSLVDAMKYRLSTKVTDPPILILFTLHEVDGLSSVSVSDGSTCYDVLLSALQDFGSHNPYFVITLSTHPRLDLHAPTHHRFNSARDAGPYAFHQVPLDCSISLRGSPIYRPGTITLNDAAIPEFMAKYGRPVFGARVRAVKEAGLQDSVVGIVDFALTKLVGRTPTRSTAAFLPLGIVLGALATRVLLDFDVRREPARAAMQDLVFNHMFIVFSIPQHREYMLAGAPSEPILAHAAAKLMNEFGLDMVRSLTEGFTHGLLDKGQRVGLVARLLLILAHDKAQAPQRSPSDPAAATNWSQKVPVLTFLEALFATDHHESIRGCFPVNAEQLEEPAKTLGEAFRGAYVRFSHFVRLGHANMVDTHVGAAALARGMAFQGYHGQPGWDVAIPVLMKDVRFDHSHVTFILIRVNRRNVDVEGIKGMLANDHPCIAIEMHLGVHGDDDDDKQGHSNTDSAKTGVTVSEPATGTTASPKHLGPSRGTRSQKSMRAQVPCYRIQAFGCSSKVYGVIEPNQEDQYASLLASLGVYKPEEDARQHSEEPQFLDCVRRMKSVWVQ